MTAHLVLESGGPVGTAYELQQGENIVGRSSSAHIQVVAGDVSRKHLCLHVSDENTVIENLSRFGTSVNDTKITAPTELLDGQRIKLGERTVFVFRSGQITSAPTDETPSAASMEDAAGPQAEAALPPSSADAIQSGNLASDLFPSSALPVEVRASDIHSDHSLGLPPEKEERPVAIEDIDGTLSGHIDMLDSGGDDELMEPPSLAAIGQNDLLNSSSAEPPATEPPLATPAPEDSFTPDDDDEQNGPHTQMMSTRAIQYLRTRHEKKEHLRKITWIAVLAVAAALAVGLILRFLW